MHKPIYLSIYLTINLSICLLQDVLNPEPSPLFLYNGLENHLHTLKYTNKYPADICLSVYLSICLYVYLSICQYFYLYICLSVVQYPELILPVQKLFTYFPYLFYIIFCLAVNISVSTRKTVSSITPLTFYTIFSKPWWRNCILTYPLTKTLTQCCCTKININKSFMFI